MSAGVCVGMFWAVLGSFGCVWGFSDKADFGGYGRSLVQWHRIASKCHGGMSVGVFRLSRF